jgi:hypothetical protein
MEYAMRTWGGGWDHNSVYMPALKVLVSPCSKRPQKKKKGGGANPTLKNKGEEGRE